MIRIYLVRHGIAAEPADVPFLDDASRPLTDKGRHRFQRLARAFARLGEAPDFLFTSPLVRAVQTAEILAGALDLGDVQVLPDLRPEGSLGRLLAEVGRRVKDEQGVALVGHDPLMSQLVSALGDLAKEQAAKVEFRKGSIVRIDVGALPSGRPSQPRWWMRPRTRTLEKGLPLKVDKPAKAKKQPKDPAKLQLAKKDGPTEA